MWPKCVVIISLLSIDILMPPCWHVNNFLPSLFTLFPPPSFFFLLHEVVSQKILIYWIYPQVIYLPHTHSFPSFLPFSPSLLSSLLLYLLPSLLLTGGGCSRQMLKCLVWSGFTRRRATRDSPMNSLCVSLSSSHTDTLGAREKREGKVKNLNSERQRWGERKIRIREADYWDRVRCVCVCVQHCMLWLI